MAKQKKPSITVETKEVDLSEVLQNEENPRFIRDEKYNQLKKSLEEFPEMLEARELVVDENMVLLGGNMRHKALSELGVSKVKIKQFKGLTEQQKKEFVVKDNVSYGQWDWEILANDWEMEELEDWGLDLPIDEFEDDLITLEAEDDGFEAPEGGSDTNIVQGDLIEIGHHRLLCGDSTNVGDVERLMDGTVPDWIHTDPPYGMNAVSKSGVLSKNYSGDILGDDNPDVAKDAFNLIHSLYADIDQVWWGANYYSSALPDSECWLVWDKNNGGSDQTDAELAWANYRSVVRMFKKASEKTNRVHPTQKPVELVQWASSWSKKSIKIVADFFGGSGVTMVWAHKSNKVSNIMEFDPKYCQVIINRMLNLDPSLEVKINGDPYTPES